MVGGNGAGRGGRDRSGMGWARRGGGGRGRGRGAAGDWAAWVGGDLAGKMRKEIKIEKNGVLRRNKN